MLLELSKNWWLFLVRGVMAVVFGVLALIWPNQAWSFLVALFGVFAILDGALTIIAGIGFKPYFNNWWALLIDGLLGIVVGVLVLVWPNVASPVLFYFIAAWAIVSGIFEIITAARFQAFTPGEWSLVIAGVLSILCGVLLIVFPSSGVVALVWVIGFYAIIYGIMEIIFSYRLHRLQNFIKSNDVKSNNQTKAA